MTNPVLQAKSADLYSYEFPKEQEVEEEKHLTTEGDFS